MEAIVNVDAACNVRDQKTGFGAVIHNRVGEVIVALTSSHPSCFSPLCTKARAVMEGLCLAIEGIFLKSIYTNP